MADGRILQIFRNGFKREYAHRLQLPDDAEANLVTIGEMCRIVRETLIDPDGRPYPDNFAWIRRDVIGREYLDDIERSIANSYEFANRDIGYLPERDGYETVADLWSCMYGLVPEADLPPGARGVGDCAIKSVALATCLSSLNWPDGRKLKPLFVAIRQMPDTDWFDHVYVALPRPDGRLEALDATPPEFRRGQELPHYDRQYFSIWS